MNNFFSEFPKIYYNYNISGENRLIVIKDIALNIRFVNEVLDKIELYDEYDIEDGETPDFVAERIYGDSSLHWLVMLYNSRYNYFTDWPMSQETLYKFVEAKYGAGNIHADHKLFENVHYTDPDNHQFCIKRFTDAGIIEDISATTIPFTQKLSNLDYEEQINDSKRRIRLFSKTIMDQLSREFESMFRVIKI